MDDPTRRALVDHLLEMGFDASNMPLEDGANSRGYFAWTKDVGNGWLDKEWHEWTPDELLFISAYYKDFDVWLKPNYISLEDAQRIVHSTINADILVDADELVKAMTAYHCAPGETKDRVIKVRLKARPEELAECNRNK